MMWYHGDPYTDLSTHRPNIVSRIFPAGPHWVTFCDSRPGKVLSSLCLIIFFTYIDVIEVYVPSTESRMSKWESFRPMTKYRKPVVAKIGPFA